MPWRRPPQLPRANPAAYSSARDTSAQITHPTCCARPNRARQVSQKMPVMGSSGSTMSGGATVRLMPAARGEAGGGGVNRGRRVPRRSGLGWTQAVASSCSLQQKYGVVKGSRGVHTNINPTHPGWPSL